MLLWHSMHAKGISERDSAAEGCLPNKTNPSDDAACAFANRLGLTFSCHATNKVLIRVSIFLSVKFKWQLTQPEGKASFVVIPGISLGGGGASGSVAYI